MMPILTSHFSHLLHLQHQQHQQQQLQQQYNSSRGAEAPPCSNTESPSRSPSPPLSVPDGKAAPNKSFTIDAILGLRETACTYNIFRPAFHPRLHVPDLARLSGVLAVRDHASSHSSNRPNNHNDKVSEGGKKCGSGKSKRVRTIFTPEQLERLEAEFERQQYMVGPERLYLAHTLQLTEAQVKVWFQNRRIKWRKQHLELQQQRLAVLKQRQRAEADESGGDSDDSTAAPAKFGFPPGDACDPLSSPHFPSCYQLEGNLSSRESLSNHCDEDFV